MIVNLQKNSRLNREISPYLAPAIRQVFGKIAPQLMHSAEELRIGTNRPLALYAGSVIRFVKENGTMTQRAEEGFMVREDMLMETLELLCDHSVYAAQEQLKRGFVTITGGHRIGVAGRTVCTDGKINYLKEISSLNIRFSREVKGCADDLIDSISDGQTVFNTLLISPPSCGKTTLLRDIARQLGGGRHCFKVSIVDERSEIAACQGGMPKNDVGCLTDILDGCRKGEGMQMLLRSMSPDVMILDEIGTSEDADVLYQMINAGVKIITSAHGYDEADIGRREGFKSLLQDALFERIVILSRRNGPGTIERILKC